QAGAASDLGGARRGEGAGRAGGNSRRYRGRLCHQELRHRRRLFVGIRRNRSRWPDCHPLRRRRDRHRHWDGGGQSRRRASGCRRRRNRAGARRRIRPAAARDLRQPLHHGSEGAGRGGAQSALGACDPLGDRRLDQRACGTHPAAEAARVVFRFGLWPAALELWGIAPNDPRANQWEKARWKDGQLILPGLAPLPLPAIAAKAHARNGVTGAMAHGFNRWAWSQATFAGNAQAWTADIDALAVRRGAGKYIRIDRSSVTFPPTDLNRSGPTYTALCGTVVRIEIDRGTGALRIAKAYSVLECGQALVPQLVLG